MSATIKYKGETIATASNNTKTLLTAGKYMEANVVVTDNGGGGATLQTKSVSYTPSETAISDSVTPGPGYDGMDQVNVSVGAISSTYVGSGIARNDSTDLTASGATVTAPAGYYASSATKTIPNASSPYLSGVGVNNDGSVDVDLDIDNGGYIASTSTTLPAGYLNVQAAQTIHPSTSDQTIPADYYLLGAQTIKGVTYSGLDASNIKKDVVVKIGDSADDDRIVSVTGTYEGGGGGLTLDQVLTRSVTGDVVINIPQQSYGNAVMNDFYGMFRGNKISSIKSTGLTWIPPHFANMDGTPNTLAGRPLVSVEMDAQYCGTQAFKYCSNLASVKLYDLTTGYHNYTGISSAMFEYCTSLTTVAFPKLTRIEGTFMKDCSSLTAVDFGALATFSGQNHFQRDVSLNALIIRTSSVATLANINTFANTPFASGGTGGTLYVPSSLISSYQAASNWSTILGYANNSIQAIEGSQYENYYADGTPIS